jgi:hypothetical protein
MRSLLLTAIALATFIPLPAAASNGQPLAIFLHGDAARTRLLETYDNVLPISVRVAGDARRMDAVTITANGPGGNSITAPLVKGATGFIGDLKLGAPGTWTLALTTRVGGVSNALAAVTIAVATPFVAEPLPVALFGVALASLACGVLLVVRPRLRRVPTVATKRS